MHEMICAVHGKYERTNFLAWKEKLRSFFFPYSFAMKYLQFKTSKSLNLNILQLLDRAHIKRIFVLFFLIRRHRKIVDMNGEQIYEIAYFHIVRFKSKMFRVRSKLWFHSFIYLFNFQMKWTKDNVDMTPLNYIHCYPLLNKLFHAIEPIIVLFHFECVSRTLNF